MSTVSVLKFVCKRQKIVGKGEMLLTTVFSLSNMFSKVFLVLSRISQTREKLQKAENNLPLRSSPIIPCQMSLSSSITGQTNFLTPLNTTLFNSLPVLTNPQEQC